MNSETDKTRAETSVEVSKGQTTESVGEDPLAPADRNVRTPTPADRNVRAPGNVRAPEKRVAADLMRRHVYETVREKQYWSGSPEAAEAEVEKAIGSKGWTTRGYLPHFDKPGAIQMITFRLADAMPAARRHEWEALLTIKDERERRTKLEAYLDAGYGECVLRDSLVARAVESVLFEGDGRRYRLLAWAIMPNHVHVLVELWDLPLDQLVKLWKGTSAHAANQILGRHGQLWEPEYWDRYVRDKEHFNKAKHYIEWNPVKAMLVREAEQWVFCSSNARWHWSGPDRYSGAHLIHENRKPEKDV